MSLRGWVALCLVVGTIGWWTTRSPGAPAAAGGATVRCPAPPGVLAGDPPLQSPVPGDFREVRLAAATLQPLAGFSLEARVLSREDYSLGRESDLSPTDLALGWGRMRDDAVLSRLDIDQSNRWYHYRWQGAPPIPLSEIINSSANMHMIPANAATAKELGRVRAGDKVRIDGWLVEADAPDGWHWRSSLSREDSGGGACEVVYVCSIARE
ncbi:hypothetical protein LVB87_07365 [Lysobacter sp. KIS68-7]|uniref:hypothetical protein n=1 Tax=Lysobacter sp. KIS68-7 TaxID=2904252 RepID=UPI001E4E8013|nr:hypothetical protein [Lysobacter sp. KIS68-7]UHQ20944.1 hypothetical protein LVB87_07365 [Lysobacter sp. KIS68-7]